MKNIVRMVSLLAVVFFTSCQKEPLIITGKFPNLDPAIGYTTWLVASYSIKDEKILTQFVQAQNPQMTLNEYKDLLAKSVKIETSPFSFRLNTEGRMSFVTGDKDKQWTLDPEYKWTKTESGIKIFKLIEDNWEDVIDGYIDHQDLLLRYKGSYFIGNIKDSDNIFLEIKYSIQND